MGDVNARVHIYTAMALGRDRVANLILGCLYPRGKPQYSFHRRLSAIQDHSGHERIKKISTFWYSGSNLGHPVHSQPPCFLSYLAHFWHKGRVYVIIRDHKVSWMRFWANFLPKAEKLKFCVLQHYKSAQCAGSDGRMSASSSASLGFDPWRGNKFSFENFQPWG